MSHKSVNASARGPSFFYLMMAGSCFQRAARAVDPKAGATLRNIGRDYLMKATKVTSVFKTPIAADRWRRRDE